MFVCGEYVDCFASKFNDGDWCPASIADDNNVVTTSCGLEEWTSFESSDDLGCIAGMRK
jgi:hypothetical protein